MTVYLCKICSIFAYDDDRGDSKTGLEPGTEYEQIPESWKCPICDAQHTSLKALKEEEALGAIDNYNDFLMKMASDGKEKITLTQIRETARIRLKGICTVNKICDGNPNRFCMGQKYGEPIGFGGVGKGMSFTANIEALDSIKLKTRLISEHQEPVLSTTIYGQNISFPIMASSLSGVKASMGGALSEDDFAYTVLQGCKDAGTIGWIGNTADEGKDLVGVEAVKKVGSGIPIFKPQKKEKLMLAIKLAEEVGATAVGVDLDGVGSTNWERLNKPLFRKSVSELKELVDYTKLHFVAKGIMSVEDAEDAVDAGVAGIDVSNHGGRALDSTSGVAEVLPKIAEAVAGKVTVTAGGGVRTGFDVLKMLASGASGVLIGRDIVRSAFGGGINGIKLHFNYLISDLRRAMILTSCNSIEDINERIIEEKL